MKSSFQFRGSLRRGRHSDESMSPRSIERNLAEINAHDQAVWLAIGGWWDRRQAEQPAPVRHLTPEEVTSLDLVRHPPREPLDVIWKHWLDNQVEAV